MGTKTVRINPDSIVLIAASSVWNGRAAGLSSALRIGLAVAAAILAGFTPCAIGATGDILLQYDSALGTLPGEQGWAYDSHCLKTNCPSHPTSPPPGEASECWFQGQNSNDCTLGHGCGPDATPASHQGHFNAPTEPLAVSGSCSYTEWIVFDDWQPGVGSTYPLTFGSEPKATYWDPHTHPAFGAMSFANAPVGHNAIRIVTGGGVPGVDALPASSGNNRNKGKVNIRATYTVPSGVTALTLLAKLACGNRDRDKELIQWTGVGRQFAFGVDGKDGSATLGRFGRGSTNSITLGMFGTRTVTVALARDHVPGPNAGEFFTVRLVLRGDGTIRAWLNEDPVSLWTAGSLSASSTVEVQIDPDEQAGTMWIDYVRVQEGEILPGGCYDPVFDVNGDHRVDATDLSNGRDGFVDCATGPASPAGVFASLSDRCKCHDVNHDGAIDMQDFAIFQRCITIGNNAVNPACDD